MIVTRTNSDRLLDAAVIATHWTAIVPAAGLGSRLNFDKPKILYPIAGRTILERLADLLAPVASRMVLVLSPEGSAAVEPVARRVIGKHLAIAVQPAPIGMADAVACGLAQVETQHTLIVWGDQVAIRPESLDFCMRLHQGPAHPQATLPTLWRERPYIHFERNTEGRLARVLQAREGDLLPDRGESDSGIFLFRTQVLRDFMFQLLASNQCVGARTDERNFLPIFPLIDRNVGNVVTAQVMTEAESVGVNSAADVEYIERILSTASRPAGGETPS